MKKFIKILFLASLITLFNASSCNKPDPEPELPTGENTAYYYLDGVLTIPYGNSDNNIKAINVFFCNQSITTFQFFLRSGAHDYLHIFFKNGIQNTGNIILYQGDYQNCNYPNSFGYYHKEEWFEYYTYFTKTDSGSVNILYLSEDKRKFKGTFEMDVYDSNNNVKHITGGHFNINLDTL